MERTPPSLRGIARRDVLLTIADINAGWQACRPEATRDLFHPDVVWLRRGMHQRIEGRDQVLGRFAEFCAEARVETWEEHGHQVDVAGDTAVVQYGYRLVYARSQRIESTGREIWVMTWNAGQRRWLAAWRSLAEAHEQTLP